MKYICWVGLEFNSIFSYFPSPEWRDGQCLTTGCWGRKPRSVVCLFRWLVSSLQHELGRGDPSSQCSWLQGTVASVYFTEEIEAIRLESPQCLYTCALPESSCYSRVRSLGLIFFHFLRVFTLLIVLSLSCIVNLSFSPEFFP